MHLSRVPLTEASTFSNSERQGTNLTTARIQICIVVNHSLAHYAVEKYYECDIVLQYHYCNTDSPVPYYVTGMFLTHVFNTKMTEVQDNIALKLIPLLFSLTWHELVF